MKSIILISIEKRAFQDCLPRELFFFVTSQTVVSLESNVCSVFLEYSLLIPFFVQLSLLAARLKCPRIHPGASGDIFSIFVIKNMKKLLTIALLLLSLGCVSRTEVRNDYIEGTSVVVGLLVPYNGSLVGIQAFTYLSGKRYKSADTNLQIQTSHTLTNSVFGYKTVDCQKTDIK